MRSFTTSTLTLLLLLLPLLGLDLTSAAPSPTDSSTANLTSRASAALSRIAIKGTSLQPYLSIHAAHLSARGYDIGDYVLDELSGLDLQAYSRSLPEEDSQLQQRIKGSEAQSEIEPCKTNAECMQRDMPLLKPASHDSSGGKLGTRSRALAPRQSGVPPISGTIQVIASGGASLGYVSSSPTDGYYGVTTDASIALIISLTPTSTVQSATISPSQQIDGFPFLAVGGLAGDGVLTPEDITYSLLVGASVDLGTGPPEFFETTFGYLPTESTIFRLDASNNLNFEWVNYEGSGPPTPNLVWDQLFNYLGLTGNVTTFQDAFATEDIVPVSFKFVPTA